MSTYWYMECVSHDPPLSSDEEISQHTDAFLDRARDIWARREELFAAEKVLNSAPTWGEIEFDSTYERNAWRFIRQHPRCRVQLRNEYGITESITLTIDASP